MVLLLAALIAVSSRGGLRHTALAFHSQGNKVAIDEYAPLATSKDVSAVIILYGSGGARSPATPYDEQARLLSAPGRWVYLPHYLDVTNGDAREPRLHYEAWARGRFRCASIHPLSNRIYP